MGTHRHLRTRAAAVSVLLAVSALTLGGPGTAHAGQLPQAEAQLNSEISGYCGSGTQAGGAFGTVTVKRLPDNRVIVWVRITNGQPHSTYVVNVTCGGAIGVVRTDHRGHGSAGLPPTSVYGLTSKTSFVIDVHLDPYADPAATSVLSLPLNP